MAITIIDYCYGHMLLIRSPHRAPPKLKSTIFGMHTCDNKDREGYD